MTETKKIQRRRYRQAITLVEPFLGPMAADWTCTNGQTKGKHAGACRQCFSGCGAVDRNAIISMKDRVSGRVAATLVNNSGKATPQGFATDHARTDSMIYTDDHKAYRGLLRQATVCHLVAEVYRIMVGKQLQHPELAAP